MPRPGAGRKPKALTEKISEGKTAEVMMEPAELEGVDVPPVKDFLKSPQKSGRELVAEEVFNETYAWLKARGYAFRNRGAGVGTPAAAG